MSDPAIRALFDPAPGAAVRGEAIRFSLHVWNDESDVERASTAIRPFLGASAGR